MPAEVGTATAPSRASRSGKDQHLQFRETDRPQPEYDGHHVQIYITDFSGPYRALSERNLISQEDNQYQYRFRDIVDLASGKHLFTVEHEVRSATHPMYLRPLINRNPAQTNRTYAPATINGCGRWRRTNTTDSRAAVYRPRCVEREPRRPTRPLATQPLKRHCERSEAIQRPQRKTGLLRRKSSSQ